MLPTARLPFVTPALALPPLQAICIAPLLDMGYPFEAMCSFDKEESKAVLAKARANNAGLQ